MLFLFMQNILVLVKEFTDPKTFSFPTGVGTCLYDFFRLLISVNFWRDLYNCAVKAQIRWFLGAYTSEKKSLCERSRRRRHFNIYINKNMSECSLVYAGCLASWGRWGRVNQPGNSSHHPAYYLGHKLNQNNIKLINMLSSCSLG
jgi:hypothetical protein